MQKITIHIYDILDNGFRSECDASEMSDSGMGVFGKNHEIKNDKANEHQANNKQDTVGYGSSSDAARKMIYSMATMVYAYHSVSKIAEEMKNEKLEKLSAHQLERVINWLQEIQDAFKDGVAFFSEADIFQSTELSGKSKEVAFLLSVMVNQAYSLLNALTALYNKKIGYEEAMKGICNEQSDSDIQSPVCEKSVRAKEGQEKEQKNNDKTPSIAFLKERVAALCRRAAAMKKIPEERFDFSKGVKLLEQCSQTCEELETVMCSAYSKCDMEEYLAAVKTLNELEEVLFDVMNKLESIAG